MRKAIEVGDTVRIRTDLEIGKAYSGVTLFEFMAEYRGLESKVESCSLGHASGLLVTAVRLVDCPYKWAEEMLEIVSKRSRS